MKQIKKLSLSNVIGKLTRNEMRYVMAGSGTAVECATSFVKCGYMGEGNCGEIVENKCVCKVGGKVAEDSNCNPPR